MSVNEDAANAIVGHRLAVLRYESGTVNRLIEVYKGALADVEAELEAARAKLAKGEEVDDRARDRLEVLQRDLRAHLRDLYASLSLTMEERVGEVARAEQAFLGRTLAPQVGLALTVIPEDQVRRMVGEPIGGAIWRDRLALDLLDVETGLQLALGQALARGLSVDRTAKLIANAGVVETYRGRLVTIARTEIQRVANGIALATYEANSDVISGVQWLGTLDSRTCPVCGSLHNRVYPIVAGKAQGLEPPPAHPRCRCFTAPVVKPWSELGIDVPNPDAYDGRPSSGQSFETWLRGEPDAAADEVFGPTRAEAWRAGTLTLDQMVSGMRPLTIGELRARYDSSGITKRFDSSVPR